MNTELYYEEHGAGKPLILLHGNGEDHTYFVHQIDYFSKFYRVIAIDTRGHGASPRGDAPFTIRQFAADLLHFMDEHQIDQAILLGFSDGGNIALVFALQHPERVSALILNGANLFPSGAKRSVQIPIEIGYRLASLFSKKSEKARRNAERLRLMVEEPKIHPKRLQKLLVKTLVIAGTNDMIRDSHTQMIYRYLANAELVFIKGNHFIANKKPATFNRAVEKFLRNCL